MTALRPVTRAGRFCAPALLAMLALGVAILLGLGLQTLTGCEVNEAGTGSCRVAGLDLMPLLYLLCFGAVFAALLFLPVLVPTVLIAGSVCLVRRRW